MSKLAPKMDHFQIGTPSKIIREREVGHGPGMHTVQTEIGEGHIVQYLVIVEVTLSVQTVSYKALEVSTWYLIPVVHTKHS